METRLLGPDDAIEPLARVLNELRPQYQLDELLAQLAIQREMGYQLAYVGDCETVLCVAGFVVAEKLAWGKHIYVDDLVTTESARGTGAGGEMLSWLKGYARKLGCEQLHLDSGVQRFDAHRFYLNHGFAINSHHFGQALSTDIPG